MNDANISSDTELQKLIERFPRHTLLRVLPRTGRSHQIRVHLASAHHPVVADRDYGHSDSLKLSDLKDDYKTRRGVVERPLLRRMFLHATRLTFQSPEGGAMTSVESPLPRDLDLVLEKLRRFGARGRP